MRADNSSRVLEIAIHGDASERVLKEEARRLKDELTALDGISFAEVTNTRDYEISIEIDRDTLRAYGLSLNEVAQIMGALNAAGFNNIGLVTDIGGPALDGSDG